MTTHTVDARRFVTDLGATAAAGNIVIGDRPGPCRALAEAGPLTAVGLADHLPHAVSEGAPDARGNQAGERPIARVIEDAGFSRFQLVAETPSGIVCEARP